MPWNKTSIQTLDEIGDVVIVSPTSGEVLKFNGTTWVNASEDQTIPSVLDDLSDVALSSPVSTDDELKFDGANWTNVAPSLIPTLTDATVAPSGADYTTVQAAIAAGERKIRILASVTETVDISVSSGSYFIFLDGGVNWTFDTDIRVLYSGIAHFYLSGSIDSTIIFGIDNETSPVTEPDLFDNGAFPLSLVASDGISFINNSSQAQHCLAGGNQHIQNFNYRVGPGGVRGLRAKAGTQVFKYQNGSITGFSGAQPNQIISFDTESDAPEETLFENVRFEGRFVAKDTAPLFTLSATNKNHNIVLRNLTFNHDTIDGTGCSFTINGNATLDNITLIGDEDLRINIGGNGKVYASNWKSDQSASTASPPPEWVSIIQGDGHRFNHIDIQTIQVGSSVNNASFDNFSCDTLIINSTNTVFAQYNKFSNFNVENSGQIGPQFCFFTNGWFKQGIELSNPSGADISNNQFSNVRFGGDGSSSPATTLTLTTDAPDNIISNCIVETDIIDNATGNMFLGVRSLT